MLPVDLLQLLETRLDNVVYRLGFADSRKQARQIVRHGHITGSQDGHPVGACICWRRHQRASDEPRLGVFQNGAGHADSKDRSQLAQLGYY